jgi:molybdate transport system permease protein
LNWRALELTIRVTLTATLLIATVGLPLSLWLARTSFRGKPLIETLVLLPLVLPPSVVGYYLLRILGAGGPFDALFHGDILFTWQAATIASAVVGFPLMVQASRAAIAGVDPGLENAARTLGSSELAVLWRVTFPLARRGILAGLTLGAARALGEFGATLMVAGNIPGRTQTLSLAIYDAVQNGQYARANGMVLVMTAVALLTLWAVRRLETSDRLIVTRIESPE